MFKNVGKDIKAYAEQCFWQLFGPYILTAIAMIIGGFAVNIGAVTFALIVAAVATIFVGYQKAKQQIMILYAYGEIADCILYLRRQAEKTASGSENVVTAKNNSTPLKEMIPNTNIPKPQSIPTWKKIQMDMAAKAAAENKDENG